MEICFLLLSIYFYFLDFGSDILLDIEQYKSLKQNDDRFTLTSFFNRSFTKHYCVHYYVTPTMSSPKDLSPFLVSNINKEFFCCTFHCESLVMDRREVNENEGESM